jgi:drug/metabolite transporter (DMT)-like permease
VIAGLLAIYLIFGSAYLGFKLMGKTMPPISGTGLRCILGGLLLGAFVAIRNHGFAPFRTIDRGQAFTCLVIGAFTFGCSALLTAGEKTVPSGLAALLLASVPIVVLLMRLIMREKIRLISIPIIFAGFIGIALLLLPGKQTGGASIGGIALVLASVFVWSLGLIIGGRRVLPKNPMVSATYCILFGGVSLIVIGLATGEGSNWSVQHLSLESLLAFSYLLIFGAIVATIVLLWLLQNAPVSLVATHAYAEALIAVVVGALVLSESVTWLTVAGGAMILLSVALSARAELAPKQVSEIAVTESTAEPPPLESQAETT